MCAQAEGDSASQYEGVHSGRPAALRRGEGERSDVHGRGRSEEAQQEQETREKIRYASTCFMLVDYVFWEYILFPANYVRQRC